MTGLRLINPHPKALVPSSLPPPPPNDASEGQGPQRRPQRRLGMRLEEVAKAVGGRLLSVTNAIEAGTWHRTAASSAMRSSGAVAALVLLAFSSASSPHLFFWGRRPRVGWGGGRLGMHWKGGRRPGGAGSGWAGGWRGLPRRLGRRLLSVGKTGETGTRVPRDNGRAIGWSPWSPPLLFPTHPGPDPRCRHRPNPPGPPDPLEAVVCCPDATSITRRRPSPPPPRLLRQHRS